MELFMSLEGRIGRGKWWLGLIVLIILNFVLAFMMAQLGFSTDIDPVNPVLPAGFWVGLLVPILIVLWPSICIYGKRYHDRNKSAWWMMIAFVPIIGAIWMLIECGFLRGTEGDNDYGPDPLQG